MTPEEAHDEYCLDRGRIRHDTHSCQTYIGMLRVLRETLNERDYAKQQIRDLKQAAQELLKARHNSFDDDAAREKMKGLLGGAKELKA